jgi:predicted GIY-YIG superfamily endonuclease
VVDVEDASMEPRFADLVDGLAPKLEHLRSMNPLRYGQLPMNMPEKGVYLFSEVKTHLYIGRSNVLRKRYHRHFRSHRGAAFAFLIARRETGRLEASYRKGEDSRDGLMKDKVFSDAFAAAKLRMREMDYRYVEEEDPVRQALLEIYCAVVLETPFNDFGTH